MLCEGVLGPVGLMIWRLAARSRWLGRWWARCSRAVQA